MEAGLSRAAADLAGPRDEDDWLPGLRTARRDWLAAQAPEPGRAELGPWQVRMLDATDYQRPKTKTVARG